MASVAANRVMGQGEQQKLHTFFGQCQISLELLFQAG